jgi:uncharacterized membrane protein YkvA (DUF1232 family)
MSLQTWWRAKTHNLKREVFALYLACRDPRVPWYAKALAAAVVAYAFSPIDLIPDFIPVVGYLDELVLVPLGVLAVRAMIPAAVLAECRERAETALEPVRPVSVLGAAIIVVIWLALAALGILLARRWPWPSS